MTNDAGTTLLQACDVVAGYDAAPVLRGIDFQLDAGEFVGLAGPNGTGKTTLLHCLTGYHAPTSGEVELMGRGLGGMRRDDIAREIAFVPQFTQSLYGFSVREMVLMGRYPYAGISMVYTGKDIQLADEALEQLGVVCLRERRFNQLSGGERQLVLLARALVQEAHILMMDEPLTGLDLGHQFQVMEHLRGVASRPGCAVLATFHDLAAAARWCTRMVLVHNGRVAADGPPAKAITADLLRDLYGVHARVDGASDGEVRIWVDGVV